MTSHRTLSISEQKQTHYISIKNLSDGNIRELSSRNNKQMSIANDPEGSFQQTLSVDQSTSPGLSNTLSLYLNRNRLIIFQYKICQRELSGYYQETINK